jgi:ABC-type nitrate/sulfonate/bicarbonate transport system permease component
VGGGSRWRGAGHVALSIALGLLVWELAAAPLPRIVMAPPSAVAVKLYGGLASGVLPLAFLRSLGQLAAGVGLAFLAAVPVGLLVGRHRVAAQLADPVLAALYAIPPVALVPFLVIWFGLFFPARVALVFVMSVFEILVTVAAGARSIPAGPLEVGRAFGATGVTLARRVLLPAVLPFVFTGLRLGLIRGIHAMIIAELFFAAANLGALMKTAAMRFDTAALLAVVVALAVFGLLVQEGLKAAEAWALPWHVRR